MSDISKLTNAQLDDELERTKGVAEIINEKELYKRDLNMEKLKRLKDEAL